ncbi:MAG: tRNA (N6-isopentenyl adenosine(37)-C2)-methylthiotransferase MiaB, partial [Dehalococcoidia bacterium]
YIWTIGCQMNRAESSEIGSYLASLGISRVNTAREADIVILNTCVVRQNAEDKVIGMLGYLKGIKKDKPDMRIALTGCFVDSDIQQLSKNYPHINHFFRPGENRDFEDWICLETIDAGGDPSSIFKSPTPVSVFIPIIQGCNNYCSYCIVPYRRGRERSRPTNEILNIASELVENGAREIVLLGQNVNAYGKDLDPKTDLASLLSGLNDIDDLKRIRFLTNHPKDMGPDLIAAMASLRKVCHHVCLPLQAGDDQILRSMNRHYTVHDYRLLVERLRSAMPDIALSTDIIVGFPGESEAHYLNTHQAINDVQFDVVHVAAYSPRTGTLASEKLIDDVPYDEKLRRLHDLENLQTAILSRINQKLIGTVVEILVEGKKGTKWYGRTYSDKLCFYEDSNDQTGMLVNIKVTSSSPWALQGTAISQTY